MNSSRFTTRSRIAVLLLFVAVAIAPLSILLDRLFGRDILLIAPYDQGTVALNRSLHGDGDPVAEIYGNPLSRPVRVVLLTERDAIRPVEDSSLLLLPVGGDARRPLQVQTVFFLARYAILALLMLAVLIALLPLPRMLSRKTRASRTSRKDGADVAS